MHVFKYLLTFYITLLLALSVQAQSVFSGRVLENKTRITLKGVRVRNLVNRFVTITKDKGEFSIAAKPGDILILTLFSYKPDTLLLTDVHDREIFLQLQVNMLNQVTITDSSGRTENAKKNMVLPYDPMFHGQTVVYQRDGNLNPTGGIALRLHYFTKDDHDKRKAAQKAEDRKTVEEIENIFTPENIGRYVPLKGIDLNNFMLLYTPDVERYKNKQFNLLTYLNACYKEWQTLSDADKKSGQLFKD